MSGARHVGLACVVSSAALAVLASCLGVEDFFFAGVPADPYRWDEVDGAIDGDLSSPHVSLVPSALRDEGFVEGVDGASLHWVFARQPEGEARTTIFFSHGNGPGIGRFWDRVEVMWQLGYQVLIYDYPGYGRSSGTASEPALYDAAQRVLEMLGSRDDVDPTRIVLYGHSMGCAPTFDVAARSMRGRVIARRDEEERAITPIALISESGWCSIEEMIRDGAFLDLPGDLISDLELDNCARIAGLRGLPVMLLHGRRDRVVPIRQLSLLDGAAAEPALVHRVLEATHIDVSVVGEPWPGTDPPTGVPRPSIDYAEWLTSLAPPE